MHIKDVMEQVPDTIKLGVSVTPSVMTVAGYSVEQWTFVLSGIVSMLFIIEKLPKVIGVLKQFARWIKSLKKD